MNLKDTACQETTRYRNPDGYGQVRVGSKIVGHHRLAYCQHHGLQLEDIEGLVILHKCDNPACINPEHLELGTQAQNVTDMYAKGRSYDRHGTANSNAVLTQQQVNEIRTLYIKGDRHGRGLGGLATRYGVGRSTIAHIVNGRTHVCS